MAYYGIQEPETLRAQICSTRGETIDLSVPATCTVGDLRSFLVEQYRYPPDTRLLYKGTPAPDSSLISSFPYGSLLMANGPPHTTAERPKSQRGNSAGDTNRGVPDPVQSFLPPRQQSQAPGSRQVGGGVPAPAAAGHFQQRPTYTSVSSPQPTAVSPRRSTVSPAAPPKTNRPKAPEQRAPKAAPNPPSGRANTSAAPLCSPPPPPPPDESAPPQDATASVPTGMPPSPRRSARTSQEGLGSARRQAAPASRNPNKDSNSNLDLNGSGGNLRASRTPASTPRAESTGQSASGAAAPVDTVVDDRAPWQLTTFSIQCIIPDLNKTVSLNVNGDASVADLMLGVVAAVPEVAGKATVVYNGKVLPQTSDSKLFNYGIRAEVKVYIASGRFSNPDTIVLQEIENQVQEIAAVMNQPLSSQQKKGYYENLMRILFRTDGLQELEGEWRQKRKDLVSVIKQLQDELHQEAV